MEGKAPLRVAIVGAGIGGLTLSSALGFLKVESQVKIDIYEASSHISEIGAGINMWKRTWEILKNIGLEGTLLKFLPRPPDDISHMVFHARKSDQSEGVHIKDLMMKGGAIRFHRADLQQALVSGPSGRLHLSHRLVSYEEVRDEVHLEFQDGSSAICDLLIGMDGIKSIVRKRFLEKQGLSSSPSFDPVWTGSFAYRGLVSADELEKEFPGHRAATMPVMYVGKLKHLVVYPVSQDRLVNIVATSTDLSKEGTVYQGSYTTPPTQELLSLFGGWEEEVQSLLRCIKHPTKWAIQTLNPLDCYASGQVILAGDAAHAMTPHQGAGAGQAIEDAYIIAHLIAASGGRHDLIPEISRIYNDIRCPAGNKVLEGSRESGLFSELVAPGFEDVVEGDTTLPLRKLVKLFDELEEGWRWSTESAESVREQALMMLSQASIGKNEI
ncbi:salicylate hydroxylase [Phlegmacium glaucopus]|nr:salicylate hydroxylase [Phlegmacium glaucopus]